MSPSSAVSHLLGNAAPVRRWFPAALLGAVALAWLLAPGAGAATGGWNEEALSQASAIPVQEGGRVKPLDTYARNALKFMVGRETVKVDGGDRKLSAIEWLLDVLFRPAVARDYACFLVEDSEILDAVHFDHSKKDRRDRYSFAELASVRDELYRLEGIYGKREKKDRSRVEEGVVHLANAMQWFESLASYFDYAREEIAVPDEPRIREMFSGRERVSLEDVLLKAMDLDALVPARNPHAGVPGVASASAETPAAKAASRLLQQGQILVHDARLLKILPPLGPTDEEPEWLSPGQILLKRAQRSDVSEAHGALVQALNGMAAAADLGQFRTSLDSFHDRAVEMAESRGEYDAVRLELTLTKIDPFGRAIWLYIVAFLALAVSWAWPNRWLVRGAVGLLIAALALHVTGIVFRCVIREKPPVLNLYDTILFISAVTTAVCLFTELVHRRGIALALSPVTGALGLALAFGFDSMMREDTIKPLEAVLDTKFWLATHVVCITIGYAGTLIAALLGNVYVVGKSLNLNKSDPEFWRITSRLGYGMICFGLIFSVTGTILGGIWANESWGRFWGWDPKENGALLICLSLLAILHARMGGYIQSFGIAMASIVAGGVVAFSWWGVNLLGIGLHSYGFTSGVGAGLWSYGIPQAAVLLLGAGHLYMRRAAHAG